jgi:hypothetical protein
MITANTSTAGDDLGIAVSGDAAIGGALKNDARVVAAESGQGDNRVGPAREEQGGGSMTSRFDPASARHPRAWRRVCASTLSGRSSTSRWRASSPPGIETATMTMTIPTPAVGRMGRIKKMALASAAAVRASATIHRHQWKRCLTR